MYKRQAVTVAMDLKFVAVDKPDGYSRQKAKELLDSYAGTDDLSLIHILSGLKLS